MFRLILISTAVLSAVSSARTVSQSIPLTQVFVPGVGYDDNDNVEAVVVGELPNPCFTPDVPRVDRLSENEFRVTQTARVRTTGACESGSSEDDPVPFHAVATLGTLAKGAYRIDFARDGGTAGVRSFEVSAATQETVDEHDYAVIRDIDMEAYFMPGDKVQATLRGMTTSSCQSMAEPQVQVVGDVVIVLPIVTHSSASACQRQLREFHRRLDLGVLAPGSYLLHVRSRNGKGAYQPFEVVKPYRAER